MAPRMAVRGDSPSSSWEVDDEHMVGFGSESPPQIWPRWTRLLLQPWKWNQACWDDDESVSSAVNKNALRLVPQEEEEDDDIVLHPTPQRNRHHGSATVAASSSSLSLSSLHLPHCPTIVYIPPPPQPTPQPHDTDTALLEEEEEGLYYGLPPPVLYLSDRRGSVETALTLESYAADPLEEDDDDDDTSPPRTKSPSPHRHVTPRRRPSTILRARSELFLNHAGGGDSFLRARANTYSSGSSRHRRSRITVSPAAVQDLYPSLSLSHTPQQPQEEEEEKKQDPEEPPPTREGDKLLDRSNASPASWMKRWVEHGPDVISTPVVPPPEACPVTPSPPVTPTTPASSPPPAPPPIADTIHCSPNTMTPHNTVHGDGYWIRDSTVVVPKDKSDKVLLEGWVHCAGSTVLNDTPTKRVYLTVTDQSPCLYLTTPHKETIDCPHRQSTTRVLEISDFANLELELVYVNSTQGTCVVLKENCSKVRAALLPMRHGAMRNETAQHTAALHLLFVLDLWKGRHVPPPPSLDWLWQNKVEWASWEDSTRASATAGNRRGDTTRL